MIAGELHSPDLPFTNETLHLLMLSNWLRSQIGNLSSRMLSQAEAADITLPDAYLDRTGNLRLGKNGYEGLVTWVRGNLGPKSSVDATTMKFIDLSSRIQGLFTCMCARERYHDLTEVITPIDVLTPEGKLLRRQEVIANIHSLLLMEIGSIVNDDLGIESDLVCAPGILARETRATLDSIGYNSADLSAYRHRLFGYPISDLTGNSRNMSIPENVLQVIADKAMHDADLLYLLSAYPQPRE